MYGIWFVLASSPSQDPGGMSRVTMLAMPALDSSSSSHATLEVICLVSFQQCALSDVDHTGSNGLIKKHNFCSRHTESIAKFMRPL